MLHHHMRHISTGFHDLNFLTFFFRRKGFCLLFFILLCCAYISNKQLIGGAPSPLSLVNPRIDSFTVSRFSTFFFEEKGFVFFFFSFFFVVHIYNRIMSGTQTIVTVMSIVAALGILGWILFAFKIGPSYGLSFQVATVKVRIILRLATRRNAHAHKHSTLYGGAS